MAKGKVLVIEDNEQNRYLVRFILEKHDYEVIEACSAAEAFDRAARQRLTLIVLDIQLPEMDGYEVARRLRANEHLADTPIVAVTSYAMVGDRERILNAGCDAYIEKPLDPETFVPRIEEVIAAHAR